MLGVCIQTHMCFRTYISYEYIHIVYIYELVTAVGSVSFVKC